uniref:Uncharacterized protein n=1 Tax=Clastoptera arizonana TaxID=38151 RepID=A0A1B6CHG9_9HEMI
MKLLLPLLVLFVANNLVYTSKVNASIPNTVESTSGESSPEKNQTVQGHLIGNHQSGEINLKSPINNRVKKSSPLFKRGNTHNSKLDKFRFVPFRPYERPFDCGFIDLRPKCKLPWYLKN